MLRAEWMYDHVSPKSNFFLNMLHAKGSVGTSKEQYRGVTYVREVAENVEKLKLLPLPPSVYASVRWKKD